MTRLVTILTSGFADWETTLLNAVARGYYGLDTAHVTPDGRPVKSMGGMIVTPDFALSELDANPYDALIVCGGAAWEGENPPDISDALRKASASGKLVGGICAGSYQLAKAGLLDNVAHTSNSSADLDATGYGGAAHYRDVPGAVTDGHIVTAGGTAPVSFMAEIMKGLGMADDNLDFYVAMHAAQFSSGQPAG